MSYFAVCSFDLKNGSYEDYNNAYANLAAIGLHKQVTSEDGKTIALPTTTIAGKFTGNNASAVRDWLVESVRKAFVARRFTSEIFVAVGGDWAWGHRTT